MKCCSNIEFVNELNILKSRGQIDYIKNTPIAPYTSFKIGGNADIFVRPKTEEEILSVISVTKENSIPLTVIGNGKSLISKNVLVVSGNSDS